MGNPASKVGVEFKEEEPDQGSVPSTPILTPKNRFLEELDPRSPSANIIRTPIQSILTPSKSPLDDSNAEVNKCDTFNINSPAPKISSIDPRSPAVDFTRTPIILPSDSTKIPMKIHNKNLDNVRKTLVSVTPKKLSDVVRRVPPKLLESMPISGKVENKRKSFIGVLETNLDYVETDLDEIIRKKTVSQPELRFSTPIRGSDIEDVEPKPEEYISEVKAASIEEPITNSISSIPTDKTNEEILPQIPTNEKPVDTLPKHATVDALKIIRTTEKLPKISPLDTLKIQEISPKTPKIDILKYENADPRSPTSDFSRTPLQILKKVGEIDLNEKPENIVIDDDGLINKTTAPKVVEITPKITHRKNTINDFEKKVSTLIYADEEAAMVSKSITNFKSNNRTPLGIQNGQPKKNVPKLKVSDKPRKSEYAVSKIPVFKDKKSAKENENIPPMDCVIPKRAQWDSNNTLIL